MGGFRSSGAETPGKVPFSSPRNHPVPYFSSLRCELKEPGRGDLGMPPSVARATLVDGPAQTTKKPPNHRLKRVFSGGCCTNGTRIFRAGSRDHRPGRPAVQTIAYGKTLVSAAAIHRTGSGARSTEPAARSCAALPARRNMSFHTIREQSPERPANDSAGCLEPRQVAKIGGSAGGEDGIRTHDTALDRITV